MIISNIETVVLRVGCVGREKQNFQKVEARTLKSFLFFTGFNLWHCIHIMNGFINFVKIA
ncbi:hypothetical protein EV142_101664 [Flavobacterium circumlabens]|uniref:Uncharacterized protein n=1 Tax=Flavobacterium circumlabens TaxID=2133765 RepID=A0ABY2B4X4_9FLAO|nr:hypothetical protein EV142_101664 [Flavobacterium circumlabens]